MVAKKAGRPRKSDKDRKEVNRIKAEMEKDFGHMLQAFWRGGPEGLDKKLDEMIRKENVKHGIKTTQKKVRIPKRTITGMARDANIAYLRKKQMR